ncbi:DUF4167 domain-containing protein, partial [Brucella abortus]
PVEASAEEAGAPRRATRRPGRPRRTAAKDSGDDTPVAEAADSDA